MGSKWAQVHLGGSRCPSSPVRFSTFLSVPTPTLHTKEAPPPLPSFLGWGAHSPPVPESSGSGVPDMFEARAAGSMGDRPGCSHDCPGRGRPWTLQAHSHGVQTAPPLTGPAPSGQVGGVAPTPQMVWGSSVGRPAPGQADTAAWAPGSPWGRLFHKPHPEEASRNQKHMGVPVSLCPARRQLTRRVERGDPGVPGLPAPPPTGDSLHFSLHHPARSAASCTQRPMLLPREDVPLELRLLTGAGGGPPAAA